MYFNEKSSFLRRVEIPDPMVLYHFKKKSSFLKEV